MDPVRKWDLLYCSRPGCGYPVATFPPEGCAVTCVACGVAYRLADDVEVDDSRGAPLELPLGQQGKYPFSTGDPSVSGGVSFLEKILEGQKISSATENMDTILEFCHKCKARTKCTYYSKQTRGADEGQTQFYKCTVCTDEWMAHS
ncbi:DNA-directed RNA polymerase I subunit [Diplonema papillatum]|nr:DNA-directed RNA polymerase I subunit [Diplonema papillatum]